MYNGNMNRIEIETPRLRLVPLGPEHLETTHRYASDVEHTRYMMFLPTESRAETLRYLARCAAEWQKPVPVFYEFAVLLDGAHIGSVSLYFDTSPELGDMGWIINPAYEGHGYATEAVLAMMDFARNRLDIRHFLAHCDVDNLASRAVMQKIGLTLTDATGTRQNRGSDEVRTELTFERFE